MAGRPPNGSRSLARRAFWPPPRLGRDLAGGILFVLLAVRPAPIAGVQAAPTGAPVLDLRLLPEVTARDDVLTLAEVATPNQGGANAASWDDLRGLIVGPAPAPGRVSVLSASDLRRALLRAGELPVVRVLGNGSCRIHRAAQRLDIAFLTERVREAVVAWASILPGTPRVEVLPPQVEWIPAGEVEIRITPPDEVARAGPLLVAAGLVVSQKLWRSIPVQCRVALQQQAPVARRRLARHHLVTASDVLWQPVVVSRAGMLLPSGPEELLGRRLCQAVRAGTPIGRDVLEEVPAVSRGELATVLLRSGCIRLTLEALAMEDGRPGEDVRFMNPTSRRTLTARILGPGEAEMKMRP